MAPSGDGARTAREQRENLRLKHNWENKTATFNAEQINAQREGRLPIYDSPRDVPDMYDTKPSGEFSGCGLFLVGIFVVPLLIAGLGMFFSDAVTTAYHVGSAIISTILWTLGIGIAALTAVWLVKRHQAGDDEEKLKAARMWNPWNIARASSGMAIDAIKERRARK